MADTLDPVYTPESLQHPELISEILDINDTVTDTQLNLVGKLDSNPKSAAIILAGGSGERFGRDGGKQLVEIAGKPILTWSAEALDAVGDIGLIVIVCPEERHEEYLRVAIDPFPFVTPITLAPAGTIRQESAYLGLEAVPNDYEYIVIHDGGVHTLEMAGIHDRLWLGNRWTFNECESLCYQFLNYVCFDGQLQFCGLAHKAIGTCATNICDFFRRPPSVHIQ